MPYCYMELVISRAGDRCPDFPAGVGFLVLADPGRNAAWALYEYTLPHDLESWKPTESPGQRLEALIDSAKGYPPALALARDEMTSTFRERQPSRNEFEEAYAESLASNLGSQPNSGFILACAIRDEPGYLDAGSWYWLLRLAGADSVRWVSTDFHVYTNALSDFDLTGGRLEKLKAA